VSPSGRPRDEPPNQEVVDGDVVQEMDAAPPVDGRRNLAAEEEAARPRKTTRGRGARGRAKDPADGAKPASEGRSRKTADGSAGRTRKTGAAKTRAPRTRKTPAASS
jgi:hypothetical protein